MPPKSCIIKIALTNDDMIHYRNSCQQAELLHYQPSIAEAIAYAKFLQANEQATKELAMNALSILVKDCRDLEPVSEILQKFGAGIWNGKGEVDDEWSEFLAH